MESKQITKSFTRITPSDALKAIQKAEGMADDGVWAYASVQVPDSSKDVVKIDGIDTSEYHNPPSTYLKIVAQHLMELPNGEPPIIGRVEKFVKTETMVNNKSTPALAFYMTWAKDGSGKITKLAQSYKDLFDGGYMDSFSVGMMVSDWDENDDGGIDFNKTSLNHIGCVTIPANPRANAIKAINDKLGKNIDIDGKMALIDKSIALLTENLEKMVEQQAIFQKQIMETVDGIYKSVNSVDGCVKATHSQFEGFEQRFDAIESSIVASTQSQVQKSSDLKIEPSPMELSEVKKAVSELRKVSGR